MVEHEKQEAAKQQMTMWVVSGIAKKEITLEPVQVEGREIEHKALSGNWAANAQALHGLC